METSDFSYKIVLMGEKNVGKSNLLLRYCKDEFSSQSNTTIGAEIGSKKETIQDNTIKVTIWDTAGDPRFQAETTVYYRGALGGVFVYDITDAGTFRQIPSKLKIFKEILPDSAISILVGNKSDKAQFRQVESADARQFAAENDMAFFETSAMDGTNVNAAFRILVERKKIGISLVIQIGIFKLTNPARKQTDIKEEQAQKPRDNFSLSKKQTQKKQKNSCC